MVILEGNGYGIKLGISDGEVMGAIIGYVYILKLGGKELSYQGLSNIPFIVLNLLGGLY